MRSPRLLTALAFVLTIVCAVILPAQANQDFPAFTSLVVDPTGVLSDADRQSIDVKLTELQNSIGVQFAVAIVPSLDGEEIEVYANRLFRKWGIGQKNVNNGLLLVLAPKERKLRFEVGYGLEGTMTDVQSKLIIADTMVPKLKADDPGGAIKAGVDRAIGVLTAPKADLPSAAPAPQTNSDIGGTDWFSLLFILFFVGILVWMILKGLRKLAANRPFLFGTNRRGSWGSGSDSSSSSSDSFSGGGGGDSGGGGASDSY